MSSTSRLIVFVSGSASLKPGGGTFGKRPFKGTQDNLSGVLVSDTWEQNAPDMNNSNSAKGDCIPFVKTKVGLDDVCAIEVLIGPS